MVLLNDRQLVININGDIYEVVKKYLRIFLAQESLTEKQLEVATALVARYSEYLHGGVKEPYASTLLFSTDTRKDIVKELKISYAHLLNTFKALIGKQIIAREGNRYVLNPYIVPNSSILFKFNVNGKDGRGKG